MKVHCIYFRGLVARQSKLVLKNEEGTGIYILVAQHLSGLSVGSAESPSHLMIRLF